MIIEILKISLQSLLINKMRSLLTMLGIIIGVSAVIIVVSLGDATQSVFDKELGNLGPNVIYINSKSNAQQGVQQSNTPKMTLTDEDAKAIQQECASILYASPNSSTSVEAIFRDLNCNTTLNGASDKFFSIQNYEIGTGRVYTDRELSRKAQVCVLGKKVADTLFPYDDPLNKIIRIKGIPLLVIGTLKEKGQSSGGTSMDNLIVIPFSTYKTYIDGNQYVGYIEATVSDSKLLDSAVAEIKSLLRERHKLKDSQEDDFDVSTLIQLLKTTQVIFTTLSIFLIFIASISLIVGGIGIMNIMLVSVTERIREIGIRMAIGAKGKDILMQFILESVVLCLVSGFLGMILGYSITILIELAFKWKIMLSLSAVFVAITFSICVGVIFGFLPAWRASRLDPIDALKSE